MTFTLEVIGLMKGVKDTKFAETVLHLKGAMDNFTRKRDGKNKTPAELAGISLNLGRNKTPGLIQLLDMLGLEEVIESAFLIVSNLQKPLETQHRIKPPYFATASKSTRFKNEHFFFNFKVVD